MIEADVAVVGGGLAGAWAALRAAREGARVVLIEAAPSIGHARGGLGGLEPSVLEHPHRTEAAVGAEAYAELLAFWRRNRAIAVAEGLAQLDGVVWAAVEPREAAAFVDSAATLQRHGEAAAALDAAQVRDRLGAQGLVAGLAIDGWGALTAPDASASLAQRAVEAGATLLCGHPATPRGWEPLELEVGPTRVRAEVLVLTAGIGARAFDHRLADSLTPVRELCLVAEGACGPGLARVGQGHTAWRAVGATTWISGARWATPHLEVGESDPSVIQPRVEARLQGALADRLGHAGAPVDRWAWITASTRDGLPLIGPLPGSPRVLVATGFGSNAASWSLAAADALVDGLLAQAPTVPELLRTRRLVRWSRG